MSSSEVPSTQQSMNKLDEDVWTYIKQQWNKVTNGTIHKDTRIILSFVVIGLFFYFYKRRALVPNPFERIHVLSGIIFVFIMIYSFEKLLAMLTYNIDTFCEEPETNSFQLDLGNRFYAGLSFIYYYLNLYAKIIINTIVLFTIIYIIYILTFVQTEGAMHRRAFWQFDWKNAKKKSFIKCIFILPPLIRLCEFICLKMFGGNKIYEHPEGGNRHNYEDGKLLRIKEFKEFISPEHLMHFANILLPQNMKIHKFVFMMGLVFSSLYGVAFINPVNKENLCNNKASPESQKVYATMRAQFRLGLLILVTIMIVAYLVFLVRLFVDVL